MPPTYNRQGSAAKGSFGLKPPALSQKLITIHWEDGSQSHVTPEHAAAIRKQAAGMKAGVSDH